MSTVLVMVHRRHHRSAMYGGFSMAWPAYGGSYGSMTGYYGGGWASDGGLGPGGTVQDTVGDSAISAAQFGGISGTGADGMGNGAGGGTAQGGT